MKWFLRRLLFLLGLSIVLCLLAIGIGRTDLGPDRLQALGVDVCTGDPCYRGIYPGMIIQSSKLGLPDTFQDGQSRVSVVTAVDGTIKSILIQPASNPFLPLNAGEAIEKFGPPCHVVIWGEAPGDNPNSLL